MKRFISLVVGLMVLVCFSSCEKKESTVQESQATSSQPTNSKPSGFNEAYENLVSQMGEVKKEQKGFVSDDSSDWLEPNGIIAHKIADFDSDGADEMLVVYTKENFNDFYNEIHYDIYMDMYEQDAGEIECVDTMQFVGYHESADEFTGGYLRKEQTEEVFAKISIIKGDGVYLLCEDRMRGAARGNGHTQDLWLVEYQNNKFCYKASFTQTGGGSSDFEYTNFSFKDGVLNDGIIYYNEWYINEPTEENKPRFDSFGEAISTFFEENSLIIDEEVASSNNPFEDSEDFFDSFAEEGEKVFELGCEVEKREYSENYSKVSFEFEIDID